MQVFEYPSETPRNFPNGGGRFSGSGDTECNVNTQISGLHLEDHVFKNIIGISEFL